SPHAASGPGVVCELTSPCASEHGRFALSLCRARSITCDFAPVSFHPMSPATAKVNVSSAGLTSTLTGTANTVANTSPKTVKAIVEAYLIPANLHSRGHRPKALLEKTARGVCAPRDGTQRLPRHRAKGPMPHKHLVDTWRQSNTMRSRITGPPGPPMPRGPPLSPRPPKADPGPCPTRPWRP